MDRVLARAASRRARMFGISSGVVAALALLVAAAAIAFTVSGLDVAKRTVSHKQLTIVVDNRGVTVYALGGESLKKLECQMRACFAIWQPLKVPSASTKIKAGPGLPGNVGIMHRVKGGFYQVMLDRHPLYYYSLDKGKKGSTLGQGIKSFGGTWHVVTK